MEKTAHIKVRVNIKDKAHWVNTADAKDVSLSELVHIAMENECGINPLDIKETVKKK